MTRVEDLVRAWLERYLDAGVLAALWHGPAARGFDDPGAQLDLRLIVTPEAYRRDWDSGRRRVRDVFRGRVLLSLPATYEDMGEWRWDPALRFEFATARQLWDADGRLDHFLRSWTQVPPQQRRRETLERYAALREDWRALGRHVQRGDGDAAALLASLAAESGMQVYFAAHERGTPDRAWLLPEFRRLAGPPWREAVGPLVRPHGAPAGLRAAVARLVELARDEIHDIFRVSRGALDVWGQDEARSG